MKEKEKDKTMGFLDHLDELRNRLIISLIAVVVCTIACYFLSLETLKLLIAYTEKTVREVGHLNLQVLGPMDAFMVRLRVSLAMGIAVASPVIFSQIWLFVSPALLKHEKKHALPTVVSAVLLFLLGGAFSIFIFPMSIRFLASFGGGIVQLNYTLDKFVSYATGFILSFGIVFQIPIVMFFLGKIGIIDYKMLSGNRKYAFAASVIVAAVITPDIFTNLIVTLPLYLLFEAGLLLIKFSNKTENADNQK